MAALMDLLPCPFCGEAGVLDGETMRGQTLWRAGCDNPNCVVEAGHCDIDRDAAIAAWNNRLAHSEPRPVAGEGIGGLSWGGKFAVTGTSASIHEVERLVDEHDHLISSVAALRARLATHSPAPTEAGEVERIARAVMTWGQPHFKHMVAFSTLCEAIERAMTSTQGGAEG